MLGGPVGGGRGEWGRPAGVVRGVRMWRYISPLFACASSAGATAPSGNHLPNPQARAIAAPSRTRPGPGCLASIDPGRAGAGVAGGSPGSTAARAKTRRGQGSYTTTPADGNPARRTVRGRRPGRAEQCTGSSSARAGGGGPGRMRPPGEGPGERRRKAAGGSGGSLYVGSYTRLFN
jgi:hypothetical protein